MKTLQLMDLPTVWQGSVNQWECDQMGHMNTQFYFHRLAEGLANFAGLIGLPNAYLRDSELTLNCHRMNTRFIREARIPSSLKLKMGVVNITASEMTVFAVLISADKEVMASFLCRVNPSSPITGDAIDFPGAVLELAQSFTVSPDEKLLPRSYETGAPARTELPDLKVENFYQIASGAFLASSCDGFGKMRIDQPVARLSDGMTILMADTRRIVIEHAATKVERVGGAMLEAKFDILNWPKLGEAFQLWSKITMGGPKLIYVESWLVNAHSRTPFAVLQTASAVFDLDARAIVSVTETAAAELEKIGISGSY